MHVKLLYSFIICIAKKSHLCISNTITQSIIYEYSIYTWEKKSQIILIFLISGILF